MNLITLPSGYPRHHIGKLKGFAYFLFEAFMRAYVETYMKLLYPSCLVRRVLPNKINVALLFMKIDNKFRYHMNVKAKKLTALIIKHSVFTIHM